MSVPLPTAPQLETLRQRVAYDYGIRCQVDMRRHKNGTAAIRVTMRWPNRTIRFYYRNTFFEVIENDVLNVARLFALERRKPS